MCKKKKPLKWQIEGMIKNEKRKQKYRYSPWCY